MKVVTQAENLVRSIVIFRTMSYSQYECCTVAVLFFVFSEFTFSLKAAISSSIYATIDTEASSVAELCLEAFSSFN